MCDVSSGVQSLEHVFLQCGKSMLSGASTVKHDVLMTGRDGELHGRLWCGSRRPEGIVLIVHGLGDHGGRYQVVADFLSGIGWCSYAFDLPGHGRSPGSRGRVDSFSGLLADIDAACQTMSLTYPGVPQVVLGHSMGGNLALNHSLRCRSDQSFLCNKPDGMILCGPMLLPPVPPPRPHIFAAWLTGCLMPWIQIKRPVDLEMLTADPEQAKLVAEDPWMHSRITLYLATQLLSQGRWALDNARRIDIPTLVMYGGEDGLIDQSACRNLAIRAGKHVTLQDWAKLRHDLFHDQGSGVVLEAIAAWLKQHFG